MRLVTVLTVPKIRTLIEISIPLALRVVRLQPVQGTQEETAALEVGVEAEAPAAEAVVAVVAVTDKITTII